MSDRLQKKKALIEASGLFDKQWYGSKYPDVAKLGLDPIDHFVLIGERLLRDPGPSCALKAFVQATPEAARAATGPLLYYIERRGQSGPLPVPSEHLQLKTATHSHENSTKSQLSRFASAKLSGPPKRFMLEFDRATEAAFLLEVERLYTSISAQIDCKLASVVMPTYNRRSVIGRAIKSVLGQSHQNWELLIADDGSDDGTVDYIKEHFSDSRIAVFREGRGGVSRARNVALSHARGEFIFFLDSDNTWRDSFLRTMLVYMAEVDASCAYSGAEVVNGTSTVGYRGEPFDWDQCLKANYVDMNVFALEAAQLKEGGDFDEKLRRMVDWDFILRYTKRSHPAYAPFIGCFYNDDKADRGRISTAQPYAYRSVVQLKNGRNLPFAELSKQIRYVISIKIPAPYEKRAEWGDFHYANSLKKSLEKLGHSVRIDFLGQWYDKPVNHDHVVIVIRGLTKYEPRPGEINILWNISHPDQLYFEEIQSYDVVYVASLSFPMLLNTVVGGKVKSLLQCSDSNIFKPRVSPVSKFEDLIFVGNSRNEYRSIVKWAVLSGEKLQLYGTRWAQFLDKSLIKGENIDNNDLANYYNAEQIVLNDHWASMRDFGYISNRLFDIVSAGGVAVSDEVPTMRYVFDKSVRAADDLETFKNQVAQIRDAPPSVHSRLEVAAFIRQHHSFDARAAQIVADVGAHLGIASAGTCAAPALYSAPFRRKIGLLLQRGRAWPTSSGFIRLVAPLTSDAAYGQLEIVILDDSEDPRLADCDACVVQRIAVSSAEAADRLVALARSRGILLFVDNDDALTLLPDHVAKDKIMRRLMDAAHETWFSTGPLRALYEDHAKNSVVLKNCLDPRLWRNYREKPRQRNSKLEILYMGTATHDNDFDVAIPALDRLNEKLSGAFRLTLIGAVRKPPQRPWLRILPPPAEQGAYPRFVHWLRQQGPFDVGIVPLAETEFNRHKSDIKFLDYSAIGLASVVSDCLPYQEMVGQGLALGAKTARDWCDALESLFDERTRSELAAAANNYLWTERNALTVGQSIVERILSPLNQSN